MTRLTASTAPLKRLLGTALVGAALAAGAAHADPITFDHVVNVTSGTLGAGDTIYSGGDAFTEAGFTMHVQDGPIGLYYGFNGLAGAQITGADAGNCQVAACPTGNSSKYYAGLNDGALVFNRTDSTGFKVGGMDIAFVAPVGGLQNFSYGQLVVTGTLVGGGTISESANFPGQNNNGEFTFANWVLGSGFQHAALTSMTVSACMFDANNVCANSLDNPAFNQAQFAIDNVNVTAVPEPSSVLMLAAGLAGLGLFARRRNKQA